MTVADGTHPRALDSPGPSPRVAGCVPLPASGVPDTTARGASQLSGRYSDGTSPVTPHVMRPESQTPV